MLIVQKHDIIVKFVSATADSMFGPVKAIIFFFLLLPMLWLTRPCNDDSLSIVEEDQSNVSNLIHRHRESYTLSIPIGLYCAVIVFL